MFTDALQHSCNYASLRSFPSRSCALLFYISFPTPCQQSAKDTSASITTITNTNATIDTNVRRRKPKGQRPKTNGRKPQVKDQSANTERQSCEEKAT